MDRRVLVRRFVETEVVGEGLVVLRGKTESVAFARGAAGIEVQQFGGGVAHLFGRLALGLFPLARAELVQRRLVGADTGVAADLVQLADRYIEGRLVGV